MFTILMPIAGACLYRWRGAKHDWKKYTPRPLTQMILALPYAYLCLYDWRIALVVFIVTTAALSTGHGGFFDLGTWTRKRDAESLEPLIRWLRDDLPRYWYDVLGLMVTGLAVTLPCGIMTGNWIIALSGLLKAPAYMISLRVNGRTELGEYITGFFLWGVIGAYL